MELASASVKVPSYPQILPNDESSSFAEGFRRRQVEIGMEKQEGSVKVVPAFEDRRFGFKIRQVGS